jgi:AraC-like DNA-binding protein
MDRLFRISKLGTEDVLQISASPEEPHHHDYETLIIGIRGKIEHFIDFQTSIIEAPFVSFINRGKVHRIIPMLSKGSFEMWVLRFKSEFIAETIFRLYAAYHDNSDHILKEGSCFNRLNTICEIINSEMQLTAPDLSIVRHLLSALFIMIDGERKRLSSGDTKAIEIENETFINFLRILEENFRRPLGVEFYAEKLFMSSRNLNLICQDIMNQSVSEIIETRKLTEAKSLLASTSKSISEIGFELGYNEKSYFSNVFKKKSGMTPSEFREEMRKIL